MQSQPDREKQQKVLVYLFGSLGDTIVAIPALRAVRRHFTGAEIVLLQNVRSGNIVSASEVIPDNLVDRSLTYSSDGKKADKFLVFYRLWREVRAERFDAAVYLVLSERPTGSVRRDRFFFRSCGIRNLYGFHAFSKKELYPVNPSEEPAATKHEALRKIERLERDGLIARSEDYRQPYFSFSASEVENINTWLIPLRKKLHSPLVAIAPGVKPRPTVGPLKTLLRLPVSLFLTIIAR